jgi:hypothetical protein
MSGSEPWGFRVHSMTAARGLSLWLSRYIGLSCLFLKLSHGRYRVLFIIRVVFLELWLGFALWNPHSSRGSFGDTVPPVDGGNSTSG